MTYTLVSADPPPSAVRSLTFVPFLPSGQCVALPGGVLAGGPVAPHEHYLLDSCLRIPLETLGFRPQRIFPFASRGDHFYVWLDGDHYTGRRRHAEITPWVGSAESLAALLDGEPARAVLDGAHAYRTQSDADYYAGNVRLLEPAYLRGATPEAGSGFGGTAEDWRAGRAHIADALHRSGTFLDVGCANGLLMESIHRWAAARGLAIEPHGVDLAPGLVALARRRLPHWAGRIHLGNAIDHAPTRHFTFVHVLLDLVPTPRRRDLITHNLTLVEPGGRLLVSHYQTAGGTDHSAAEHLRRLGLPVHGHLGPGTATVAWIEVPVT